ncbi:uncharacterized protein BX663DRAFT_517139 [Cokeromyces recurvatus]|uniref:uncharacterized protein n=1 Tax=Cokeromyces recurvatus TaxID=90255 RepID=UPI00221EACC1|nr:uncharacterized protein BX663DRAFT_517139 [Cokeromyces recurvatus]KAI7900657.1 hypothetical protein BX663DRAFT_517139 [Cokeromyces recurvatus]
MKKKIPQLIVLFFFFLLQIIISMLRTSLKNYTNKVNSLLIQKRLYQQERILNSRHYGLIGLTALVAGGSGYWFASYNNQSQKPLEPSPKVVTKLTTEQRQPQVPVPDIPSRETITKVFTELRRILPEEHVSVDEESLKQHGYSSNSYHNEGAPNIVVYPETTQQVSEIVKVANRYGVPVVPFSGGTSLEGHFTAPRGGISISFTEHMDHVVEFHPEDMDIVVQPGVQWEDLNTYLKPHGLFFPMDPGPGACIGGMVGTSCSGTNAVRYGTMREWVINLTVVTPTGEIIKTRQRPRKSSAGYDLTKLYIGSEGTLGVVTEITLKLAVLPAHETVAVCDFPSIRDAAAVVPDLIRAGIQIGAVELLDSLMMKAIRLANPKLEYAQERPTLFFKFSGRTAEQLQEEIKVVSNISKSHGGGAFKYAHGEQERAELWEGRKIALWSSMLLKPGASLWTTDVVVPVSKLPDLIAETEEDIKGSVLKCPMVGHVGDGNFHLFILFDKETEYEEAKKLNKNLLERAIRMEGSVTGEHGVGIGKKMFLTQELGHNTIDVMKKIKMALDPKGLMNPEKVLPDN